MELGIAGANARAELEWTENHEEKAGNDVNESEDGALTVSWERILAQLNVLRAFLVKFLNKL
jgi:hypothetical protein